VPTHGRKGERDAKDSYCSATVMVAAGLIGAVVAPAAATKPPTVEASCRGQQAASLAGEPGALAQDTLNVIAFANNQGQPPGALVFSIRAHRFGTTGFCLD
jgi:hypothetical protein